MVECSGQRGQQSCPALAHTEPCQEQALLELFRLETPTLLQPPWHPDNWGVPIWPPLPVPILRWPGGAGEGSGFRAAAGCRASPSERLGPHRALPSSRQLCSVTTTTRKASASGTTSPAGRPACGPAGTLAETARRTSGAWKVGWGWLGGAGLRSDARGLLLVPRGACVAPASSTFRCCQRGPLLGGWAEPSRARRRTLGLVATLASLARRLLPQVPTRGSHL